MREKKPSRQTLCFDPLGVCDLVCALYMASSSLAHMPRMPRMPRMSHMSHMPCMRFGRVSRRSANVTIVAWYLDDGDRHVVRHGVLRGRRPTIPVGMPVMCVADGMHIWQAWGASEAALLLLMVTAVGLQPVMFLSLVVLGLGV